MVVTSVSAVCRFAVLTSCLFVMFPSSHFAVLPTQRFEDYVFRFEGSAKAVSVEVLILVGEIVVKSPYEVWLCTGDGPK